MSQDELIALARLIASQHGLDGALVAALCDHESGGWNPWAMRYEPAFFSRYVAPLYTAGKISATEAYARAFSYGLGQVMGQTARELGFEAPYLTELCDPATGIEYACRKLAKAIAAAEGDVTKALLLYNGGSNPTYANLVLDLKSKYDPPAHPPPSPS